MDIEEIIAYRNKIPVEIVRILRKKGKNKTRNELLGKLRNRIGRYNYDLRMLHGRLQRKNNEGDKQKEHIRQLVNKTNETRKIQSALARMSDKQYQEIITF